MAVPGNLFHSLLNEEVYKTGDVKSFPAGSVILNINAYIKSIPIVLSGSMKVIMTDEDGQEILLYYIKTGRELYHVFFSGDPQ